MKILSQKYFNESSKQEEFLNKLTSSNDLRKLLFESSLCSTLDEIGGVPKILLTVMSKYGEVYMN